MDKLKFTAEVEFDLKLSFDIKSSTSRSTVCQSSHHYIPVRVAFVCRQLFENPRPKVAKSTLVHVGQPPFDRAAPPTAAADGRAAFQDVRRHAGGGLEAAVLAAAAAAADLDPRQAGVGVRFEVAPITLPAASVGTFPVWENHLGLLSTAIRRLLLEDGSVAVGRLASDLRLLCPADLQLELLPAAAPPSLSSAAGDEFRGRFAAAAAASVPEPQVPLEHVGQLGREVAEEAGVPDGAVTLVHVVLEVGPELCTCGIFSFFH